MASFVVPSCARVNLSNDVPTRTQVAATCSFSRPTFSAASREFQFDSFSGLRRDTSFTFGGNDAFSRKADTLMQRVRSQAGAGRSIEDGIAQFALVFAEQAVITKEANGGLAKKLKKGTAKSHTAAENVAFVRGFLNGLVEKAAYRKLAANFYYIYSAMEEELYKNRDHPLVKPIYFPELERKATLETDLQYYYGDNWQNEISPSPACQEYVKCIHELGKNEPGLLVAHSYTRYMGDLSGGQILKNIAVKAMNLGEKGVAFYEFPTITDERAFKNMYRAAMDALPCDEAYTEKIVAEANNAFVLNMNMFKELEGNYLKTIFQMVWNTIVPKPKKKPQGRVIVTAK